MNGGSRCQGDAEGGGGGRQLAAVEQGGADPRGGRRPRHVRQVLQEDRAALRQHRRVRGERVSVRACVCLCAPIAS